MNCCIALCPCCLLSFFRNKTKWVSCVASCGRAYCCCFFFGGGVHSTPKRKVEKMDTAKTQKKQKCRKKETPKNRLAHLCSQIVFQIFGGGF